MSGKVVLFSLFPCSGKVSASNQEYASTVWKVMKKHATFGKFLFISLTENVFPNGKLCLYLICSFHLLSMISLYVSILPTLQLPALVADSTSWTLLPITVVPTYWRPPSVIMGIIAPLLQRSFLLHSYSPFNLSLHCSQIGLPKIENLIMPLPS